MKISNTETHRSASVNWNGNGRLLFLMVALVLAVVLGTTGQPQLTNVQPALLAMAAEQPDTAVRVIIQKSDPTADVETAITRLGGLVINDLHIINALVAQLPTSQIPRLAQSSGVRWVSLDGPVENAGKPPKNDSTTPTTTNTYLDTLGVRDVWAMGYDGQGIGIALIDSGIDHSDLNANVLDRQAFNVNNNINDYAGHGTHVAGIIAGNGNGSRGDYAGVAPGATLLSLNVSAYNGRAYESDVVAAMQWVYDNKDVYNIRVVNLSINGTAAGSYHESPMNAAAEILWFNGIVVVVSAGNSGTEAQIDNITAAPANDPFFIAVGATNENGTDRRQDDTIPTFSASGWTLDYHSKPDIFAPGVNIISTLANASMWEFQYPDRKITASVQGQAYEYFRASGTSMSAPMVSGAVALLLQAEPNLTPDQVKSRLIIASSPINGYPYLNVYKAMTTSTYASANTGLEASQLLWTGDDPLAWDSVNWGSVNWGSVNWGSVNWGSVNWGSVNWGSVNWDD